MVALDNVPELSPGTKFALFAVNLFLLGCQHDCALCTIMEVVEVQNQDGSAMSD